MTALTPLATMWSLVVVINVVVSTRYFVSTTRNGDLEMDMYITVRKKRSEPEDFTVINRFVCPPSLCRSYDEITKEPKPRPRGTGGTIFYQGDIILDDKMTPIIYKDDDNLLKRRRKRATMKPRRRMWKNGIVKYKFAKLISDRARKALTDAMEHIQNKTCIRFEAKSKDDENFIRFISEPGCWSQVGKVGGVQLLSLGASCESLGTATHELVHALGVWHEQARPDRNRNVKILKKNISPMFMPDFEVVDRIIASNRGYPYDYRSLMHYSSKAFTRNGRPTIEVIGKGRSLGLRIGQRMGLSTIDIAQIRDMYKCNHKTNVKETDCEKGWKKKDLSCYKFFPKTKEQFGPASASCGKMKSHLLKIDNKREQRFLEKYFARKYPNVTSWRTAGRQVNHRMVWYLGPGKVENMTYTNWAKYNPKSYTSAILRKSRRDKKYKWYGDWVGSYSQRPHYEHAYICEKAAKRKCVRGNFADGRDYRGTLDFTRDGYTCQKWTENYPRNHSLRVAALDATESKHGTDKDGLGDHNYCRNPSGQRRNRPWCFTTKKKSVWGFCDVSTCRKSVDRFNKERRKRTLARNKVRTLKQATSYSPPSKTTRKVERYRNRSLMKERKSSSSKNSRRNRKST